MLLDGVIHRVALIEPLADLLGRGIDRLHRVIGVDPHHLGGRRQVLHQSLRAPPFRVLVTADVGVVVRFLLRQRHDDVDRHVVFVGGGLEYRHKRRRRQQAALADRRRFRGTGLPRVDLRHVRHFGGRRGARLIRGNAAALRLERIAKPGLLPVCNYAIERPQAEFIICHAAILGN
ncbi:hypothetical protein D3C87_1437070 [compost metagenome]